MTREEVIKHIKDIICENNTVKHSNIVVFEEEKEALRIAIKALEQEPCEDAISRQAFIKRYEEWMYSEYGKHCEKDALAIRVANSLPPVTPSRRKGHWIKTNSGYECSECAIESRSKSDFCQYCGAEMESEV